MGLKNGQMFSLEVLFATVIMFLIFILIEKLEEQELNNYFLEKKEIIERYSSDYVYMLIKSNQISQAITTKNYTKIKNREDLLGLCTYIEIYNQTKNISNLVFSHSQNCTINKEENNKEQKIFFEVIKNRTGENFYIVNTEFYEVGK